MTYANMANAPTQTAGSSPVLASDWNTFVRDNFADIRAGHIVCTSSTRPSTGLIAGTMVYESDTKKVMGYTGSAWVELFSFASSAGQYPLATPVGTVTAYAAPTASGAPAGWVFCDGSTYNGNSGQPYNNLWNVIGATYGGTQAAFNVPDLRGRVITGAGTGTRQGESGSGVISGGTALSARTVGQWFGDERLQAHTHTYSGSTGGRSAGHTHGGSWSTADGQMKWRDGVALAGGTASVLVPASSGLGAWYNISGGISTGGESVDHSHGFSGTTSAHSASQGAQNNLQPSIVLNYIIKY